MKSELFSVYQKCECDSSFETRLRFNLRKKKLKIRMIAGARPKYARPRSLICKVVIFSILACAKKDCSLEQINSGP